MSIPSEILDQCYRLKFDIEKLSLSHENSVIRVAVADVVAEQHNITFFLN